LRSSAECFRKKQKNYLSSFFSAGLLAFAFAGAFAAGLLAAVFVVVEFVTVVELPLAAVLVVLVVFVVEVEFAVFAVFVVLVVLAGLLVALLAVPASPQAMPRALIAKTVESTITFFILKTISCLLQSWLDLFPRLSFSTSSPRIQAFIRSKR
jgi:hypothetical protein